jgi:hypothetical protein
MKTRFLRFLLICAALPAAAAMADDDSNDEYRLTTDASYLSGDIETRQHVYYPGDILDIRVALGGNTALVSSQGVDLYLGVFDPAGKASFTRIADYQSITSKRLFYIQDISTSVISVGTYQLALIMTVPGGDPELVSNWYNGIGGLLDNDAVTYSQTPVAHDNDRDGEWDDDYDRDGFYGDDDSEYRYFAENHADDDSISDPLRDRDWEDSDWNDDQDSDSDNDSDND